MMRQYSVTLPSNTTATFTISGPTLIARTNALLADNQAQGWTYEDCLTIQALTSLNGEKVENMSQVLELDTKDYLGLRALVNTLVVPSTTQLEAMYNSLTLLDNVSATQPTT